jgi:hypothetical protein
MPARSALVLLAVLAAPPVAAGPVPAAPPAPEVVHYVIDARLDAINHVIVGRARVTWRNPAASPASELQWQLAWNAWRDEESSWARERRLAGGDPFANRGDADRGFIDVTALTVVGADGPHDRLPAAHFIAPDDDNAADRTVLAVPLDRPVAPGESVTVELAWNAHVPRPFGAIGIAGRTFLVADWFPQLGVFTGDRWHSHETHAGGGHYADTGRYDVALTLPQGWPVAASGPELAPPAPGPGGSVHRFTVSRAHGFGWTTSPDYLVESLPVRTADGREMPVRLFLRPEHALLVDRYAAAIRAGLAGYTAAVGPYPWESLTIVDPGSIDRESAAGGYADAGPGLVVAAGSSLDPPTSGRIERAVLVGLGEQYFRAAVAGDPVEHAWMTDGLSDLVGERILAAAFAHRFVRTDRYFGGLIVWPSTAEEGAPAPTRAPGAARRAQSAPATPSWRRDPAAADDPWLDALERHVGRAAFDQALSRYYGTHAGARVSPDDVFTAIEAAAGVSLGTWLDIVYRRGARFDYAVGEVRATPTDTGSIDTAIGLRRLEDGILPVDVRVRFADGASVVERWDGVDAWHVLRLRRGTAVVSVEIDPDDDLPLDVHRTNNSWTAAPAGVAVADTWALRWLTWAQHLLMTYAFFA